MNVYQRGTVWIYKRELHEKGITSGTHPCILVSPDNWNANHSSVIVVPCTSKQLAGTATGLRLNLDLTEGNVFPTQLTTVPKSSLFSFYGKLSDSMMAEIDALLELVVGLKPEPQWGQSIRLSTQHPTILTPSKDRMSEDGLASKSTAHADIAEKEDLTAKEVKELETNREESQQKPTRVKVTTGVEFVRPTISITHPKRNNVFKVTRPSRKSR